MQENGKGSGVAPEPVFPDYFRLEISSCILVTFNRFK